MPLHLTPGLAPIGRSVRPQVNGALDTEWSAHDGCH
jgi:hypothetical protein